jgi:hypothetical protein
MGRGESEWLGYLGIHPTHKNIFSPQAGRNGWVIYYIDMLICADKALPTGNICPLLVILGGGGVVSRCHKS